MSQSSLVFILVANDAVALVSSFVVVIVVYVRFLLGWTSWPSAAAAGCPSVRLGASIAIAILRDSIYGTVSSTTHTSVTVFLLPAASIHSL